MNNLVTPQVTGASERSRSPVAPPAAGGWIRRLWPLFAKHFRKVIVTMTAAIAGVGAMAATPLVLGRAFDDSIIARTTPIWIFLATLGGLGVARFVSGAARRWYAGRVSLDIEYDLRNAVYDHLQGLDFATHDQLATGQLVSRANSDVRILQMVFSFLPFMSANIVMIVASAAFMLALSPKLSLVAFAIVPLMTWVSNRMRKKVYPATWDAQQQAAHVAGVVDESVSGIRVVKSFAAERRQMDKLEAAARDLFASRVRNVRIQARYVPFMQTLPTLGMVALLFWGGRMVLSGEITLGTLVAFTSYLVQLVAPTRMMAMVVVAVQAARAAADRVLELLDSSPEVSEAPDAVPLVEPRGGISFADVTFGYVASNPVLKGFSLDIRPGETVALVGASGSGKSTITMLLPRFYDPDAGRIMIDGRDVRELTLHSLRSQVGVCFEDAFLFSTTIGENIAYGREDATDEQIRAAARAAEADGFISAFPDGYDTVVGEHGLTLSGGQRQRIALARALLTDPKILLLDDATSAIDARVEAGIHATLRRLMRGRTTVLIAHRRSTLALADRIVVVENGRAIAEGTHEHLRATCRPYRRLLEGPDESIDGALAEQAGDTLTPGAWGGGDRDPSSVGAMIRRSAGGMESGSMYDHPGAMRGGPPMSGYSTGHVPTSPPSEEVLRQIEALPPANDQPDVDMDAARRPDPDFGVRKLVGPHLWALAFGVLLVSATAAAQIAGPWLVRLGINRGVLGRDISTLDTISLVFLGIVAIDFIALRGQAVWLGRFSERLLFWLRTKVFAHLMRLGADFYDREMAGRVMTRMTSDVEALSQLLQQGLVQLVINIITLVGVVVALFLMNARLAAVLLPVVAVLVVFTAWFRNESDRVYLKVRDRIAAVLANLQESISGIRVSQAFAREGRNMADFRRVSAEHLGARLDGIKLQSIFFPVVEFLGVLGMIAVLGVGMLFVKGGTLTPGDLIAFVLYLNLLFAPIQQLSQVFDTYQQARAAMTKIREVLATASSTPDVSTTPPEGRAIGAIALEGVRFRYAEHGPWALDGVDISIDPGETVALVGETGAGKSTILKLVVRFYDPTSGRVLLDGRDVRDLPLHWYRRELGVVLQEGFLFVGTIRDNIAFGHPDASDLEVERAARTVGAHDFIARLDDGYLTAVSERGRSLSSGERQLIALARAALIDPPILLLDEATSQLDLATEAVVQQAMGVLSAGRTTIVIAHRLPTAKRADRIVVIDHGRVMETGSHDELLAGGGRYAEMWRLWEEETPAEAMPMTQRGG